MIRASKARRRDGAPDLILLITDIQGIEEHLREFERKYRLRSEASSTDLFRRERLSNGWSPWSGSGCMRYSRRERNVAPC